jgi:hypothetical protein
MKYFFCTFSLVLISITSSFAQLRYEGRTKLPLNLQSPEFKIQARSYVFLIGIQRGKYTFLELGAEKHWTKVRLIHQRTYALGGNMEYNFGKNVLGYKISAWTKVGRLNFTYGVNLCYFTDFDHSRYGAGPAIGFRLLGFHLINGYNFTFGNSELVNYNKLYITLRYNFPLDKKIRFRKSK